VAGEAPGLEGSADRAGERRLSATPQAIDAVPTGLPGELLKAAEYRRFTLHGRWIPRHDAGDGGLGLSARLLGADPAATDDGRTLYVNRGFVPMGTKRDAVVAATPAVPVEVTGLLRLSEPRAASCAQRPAG
jgi:surfeit locus 1 family protein